MQILDLLATSDAGVSMTTGPKKRRRSTRSICLLSWLTLVSSLASFTKATSQPAHTITWRCVMVIAKQHYSPSRQSTVKVPAYNKPVGRESMNRAVQGDVVVVIAFLEGEWKTPADAVVDQDSALLLSLSNLIHFCMSLPCETMALTIRILRTTRILESLQSTSW